MLLFAIIAAFKAVLKPCGPDAHLLAGLSGIAVSLDCPEAGRTAGLGLPEAEGKGRARSFALKGLILKHRSEP